MNPMVLIPAILALLLASPSFAGASGDTEGVAAGRRLSARAVHSQRSCQHHLATAPGSWPRPPVPALRTVTGARIRAARSRYALAIGHRECRDNQLAAPVIWIDSALRRH